MQKFKNIVIGISGGVDSAVSALLLKKKGFNVQGVFMQNWDIADETGHCSADKDYEDAQEVCHRLEIPLKHVNFVKEYWSEVFNEMVNDYQNGFTPNPDILCNRYVKFNHFYKYAINDLKADAIATGHYARNSFGCFLEYYSETEDAQLLQAKDHWKDQTLFISQMHQTALRRTMFPVGELTKREVKRIATDNNMLNVLKKKESMGICFIGSRNFQNFIADYISDRPGNFVDIESGKIVGAHKGVHQWTLGQRCRLNGHSAPYFVTRKDADTNTIFVSLGSVHPALQHITFYTEAVHWIRSNPTTSSDIFDCEFVFQHTHEAVHCTVFQLNITPIEKKKPSRESDKSMTDCQLFVRLDRSVRAITPGQYAVFYKRGECLGSARIREVGPSEFILKWKEYYERNNAKLLYYPHKTRRKAAKCRDLLRSEDGDVGSKKKMESGLS